VVFTFGVSVVQVVTLSIKDIVRAVYMTSYLDNLSHGSPAEVEQGSVIPTAPIRGDKQGDPT
jgi:hypothetical protein